MLVLGRKENESILIGDNIRITVVGRSGSSIRIGVQAPQSVQVVREELLSSRPPGRCSTPAKNLQKGIIFRS